MLRFIQEVNTTSRYCALWDLEEDTDYTVHVQTISMRGSSPPSTPLHFRTPKEAEKQALKTKDEVTMEEVGQSPELQAGELIIIVVVLLMWAGERVIIIVVELLMWAGERVIFIVVELLMWAGVIALFCRQYDIIKDNEPNNNNNKDKAKSSSECSTPEHQTGGLLRSKFPKNRKPSVNIIQV